MSDSNAVQSLISQERERQEQLWGPQNHDNPRWLVILAEEFGEAARAIFEDDLEGLREELVQVAAVASAWVECLLRREQGARMGEDE